MFKRIILLSKVIFILFNLSSYKKVHLKNLIIQMQIVGNNSAGIVLLTAFCVGMVFSLQVVKELLYLNATNLIGSILTISFIRELSPILTAIIIISRVGSSFTAELASMSITEQLDALYILGINPLSYLVIPRVYACLFMLPLLNILSFATSLSSSAYLCFILYNIDSRIFFFSALSTLCYIDLIKSSLKSYIFAFVIAIISCSWGLSSTSSTKSVGISTTSSVVISLVLVLTLDFFLSYYMFNNTTEALQLL